MVSRPPLKHFGEKIAAWSWYSSMPEGLSGLFVYRQSALFIHDSRWIIFRNSQICFLWTALGGKKQPQNVLLSRCDASFRVLYNCSSLLHRFIFSFFFFFTRLFYFYFLTTFLPVAGLQPFRPVTSNCCSSAASPALASGGCSQHRISFNLKRAISQQRACREEFNKSRYAHVRASTHISVFCINTSRIINSLTVLCPQDLLNDWESQRSVVEELNKTGSELESVIIDITAPQTKTGKQKHKDIHSIIAIKLKSLTLTSLFYC